MKQICNTSNLTYKSDYGDENSCEIQAESNTVTTDIYSYNVSIIKSASKKVLEEGEIATHGLSIRNGSDVTLVDPILRDFMTDGAKYVEGSLKLNGEAIEGDIADGLKLDDFQPKTSILISYEVQADSPATLSEMTDYAEMSYTVQLEECGDLYLTETSNTVTTELTSSGITVVKYVDRTCAAKGMELVYTTVITNNGSSTKRELVFTDHIPDGVTFVEGSVTIKNKKYPSYDPETGFDLPDLETGDSVTVEFKVTVD